VVLQQPYHLGRQDQNVVNTNLEYIGLIVEIVELNYRRHYTMFLVCNWVKANYRGKNATMKKNE